MDQVEEVKSKVDIVELITPYVQLKRAGRNFKGLCPFHGEKTPSLMVNPELQIFKCFGCGAGGDAFTFLQKIEGMEFGEALKNLAEKTGVKLETYQPTKAEEVKDRLVRINSLAVEFYHYLLTKHKIGETAREYLKQRRLSDEVIERFKLGYAPEGWDFLIKFLSGKKSYKQEELERAGLVVKSPRDYYDRFRNRIMFPLNNPRGQTVGFAGRVLPGGDLPAGRQAKEEAKYINTPETEIYHKGDLLYGLDVNRAEIKNKNWAVVVEGEVDAIASYQAGIKNVVAIKGSALTEKQVEWLKRLCETIVLSLDADLAGDAAARRGIEIAEKAGLIIKVLSAKQLGLSYKDPGDWATEDPKGWTEAMGKAIPIYDFYIQSATERFGLTAEGKVKIGRELLPILAKIDDEIMKAHYIKKLAEVLGVGEEDVRAQLTKIQNPKSPFDSAQGKQIPNPKEQNKSRREVVEGYLVGMALRYNKVGELGKKDIKAMFKTEFWKKVIDGLTDQKTKTGIKELISGLSAELRPKVEELVLWEDELDEKEAGEEWSKTLDGLEEIDIREQIAELTVAADKKAYRDEVRRLTKRLSELTKDE